MQGQHRVIRNEFQRDIAIKVIEDAPFPFQLKVMDKHDPKTSKQVRYAHSLCNALAAYKQCDPETAKKDAKVAYGVVVVCTSVITGDRAARLKSFADYTKKEMEGFIGAMCAYLDMNQIPYTPAEERK